MAGRINQSHSIFAPIVALSFAADQEQDCSDFLAKRSATTELVPISDEAQLALTVAGRLADSGYMFNFFGFQSTCNAISPGLLRLFSEISGVGASRLVPPELCSIPAAVGIYNQALRVKFDALRERSLLADHSAKLVDGILGLNHKLLDNSVFLDLLKNERSTHKPMAIFRRAELVGRELKVYILDPETQRADVHPDSAHTFATGWYFCNREDSGNSVRAIPCIYTKFGIALEPDGRKQRLVHVGTDLAGRAGQLIGRTLQQAPDLDELRVRIKALLEFKLGFTDSRNEFDATCKKWMSYLLSFGVPKDAAGLIAKNAGMVGADLEPRNPLTAFTSKVLVERNGYDLVCAILKYARNQPTNMRERLQVIGMSLLLPKTKKKFGS